MAEELGGTAEDAAVGKSQSQRRGFEHTRLAV
jgi:hypothetical protein